jgi:hypothetical protein
LARQHGVLRLRDLRTILKQHQAEDYHYPRDKHPYIIDIMKKFELCYDLDPDTVLIPQALGVVEPPFEFAEATALKFVLKYDFLPPSVMPRFIVKRHQDIKGDLRWRSGVVLENEVFQATAVVRADNEAKQISIAVNGPQRQDYLAVIRLFFKEINDSFEKLTVQELVPLPDHPTLTANFKTLVTYAQKGLDDYIPDGSEQVYSVRELLGLVDFGHEDLLHKLEAEGQLSDDPSVAGTINRVLE